MKKIKLISVFLTFILNAYSQNVIQGEYFVGDDPGFGNATSFSISLPDTDVTQSFNIPYSAFPNPGYQFVFGRVRDAAGSWSHTFRRHVDVDRDPFNLNVIRVEYFFDVDDGFGNDSSLVLVPSTDSTWTFNIPYNQLPATWQPNDTLFLRERDSLNNNWSITTMIDSLNFTMVGVNELAEQSGISIYPNPFAEEITIKPFDNKKITIVIYDTQGRKIIEREIQEETHINMKEYADGIYTVFISKEKNKMYSLKLLKQ